MTQYKKWEVFVNRAINDIENNPIRIESVNLVLTNRCNFQCPYCLRKDYKNDTEVSADVYIEALSKLPYFDKCTITGGEPTLRFNDALRVIEAFPNVDFRYFTNASLLDRYNYEKLVRYGNVMVAVSYDGKHNYGEIHPDFFHLNFGKSVYCWTVHPKMSDRIFSNFKSHFWDNPHIHSVHLTPATHFNVWTDAQRQACIKEYGKILNLYRESYDKKETPKVNFDTITLNFRLSRWRKDYVPVEEQEYTIDMLGGEFCLDSDGLFKIHAMGGLLHIPNVVGDKDIGIDKYKVIETLKQQLIERKPIIESVCDGSCAMCSNTGVVFCVNSVRAPFGFAYIEENHCFTAKVAFAFWIAMCRILANTEKPNQTFDDVFNEIANYYPTSDKQGKAALVDLIGYDNISELETKWFEFISPYNFPIIQEKGW